MNFRLRDLWSPTGTVDRGTYVIVGVLGFAIKHNLDRFIAYRFQHTWGLFSYWEPLRSAGRITTLSRAQETFLAVLVATALPFIWIGVVMTLKRLRSAGISIGYVFLFFVPFLNLLFFLVLALIPARGAAGVAVKLRQRPSWLQRMAPESAAGSAAFSLLITVPLGVAVMAFGSVVLQRYGWGLFIALPFTMGFGAAFLHSIRQPRSLASCISVAALSIAFLGLGILALAFEGIVCLLMALPLALPIAIFGGAVGYAVQKHRWTEANPAFLCALLLFSPGVQWAEHVVAPKPETFVVRSAIEINAPPEKVWKQVIAFSEIGAPQEWMFRAGIAYPVRAEIIGSGVGAERHCVFSTGAFVEPIQVWDEPHLLKFSVTANPPPMQEWTPYAHIDPPHLHGFLVSNGGQFLLTPLPNGRTRLEGTTWYHHGLWPSQYWRLWSDEIIHRIHMRVLTHIRDEAEKS